jgi:hypothetical protein
MALKYLKIKRFFQNTRINLYLLVFLVEISPKLEDEYISEMF